MCAIIWSDYLFYRREEAFVSSGESGEPETVRSSVGNSLRSPTMFEDASEEVLAAEAGGVRDDNGPGGLSPYAV